MPHPHLKIQNLDNGSYYAEDMWVKEPNTPGKRVMDTKIDSN
jgi:hypothetical protein